MCNLPNYAGIIIILTIIISIIIFIITSIKSCEKQVLKENEEINQKHLDKINSLGTQDPKNFNKTKACTDWVKILNTCCVCDKSCTSKKFCNNCGSKIIYKNKYIFRYLKMDSKYYKQLRTIDNSFILEEGDYLDIILAGSLQNYYNNYDDDDC